VGTGDMRDVGLEGRKVLVTGSSGRIGTGVVRALLEAGASVVAIDRRGWVGGKVPGVTVVSCDVTQEEELAAAAKGADGVVHLAAIPSPRGAERIVFHNNVLATYRVLEAAVEARVKCAVIASSVSALGLAYAPFHMSPLYVPVDEAHVLRPADPYALSKQCDEEAGAMFARGFGLTVYAFRFPFTAEMGRIRERASRNAVDPSDGERELWAYLSVGDAARAVRLGLEAGLREEAGVFEVFNIVADDAIIDMPFEAAVRKFHPSTEVRASLGSRSCGYTTNKAKERLGFSALEFR